MENQENQQKLQELKTSIMTFNAKWRAERWPLCPLATDMEAAKTILDVSTCAVVVERGMKPKTPEAAPFYEVCRYLIGSKPWMVLYGTPGTGKSTYMRAVERAARMAHDTDSPRPSIRWEKASDLGYLLKNNPEGWDAVKKCKLLLLDDIGFSGEAEVVNNYGVIARPVTELIEFRYDAQLHTVMTTNLLRKELREKYGERIWSRLCEMAVFVKMNGRDWRQG